MTIVLGFDGTPAALAALDTALDLATRYGERLLIVYGVEPPGTSVGEEHDAHRAEIEELARPVTARAADTAVAAGVDAEVVLVHERPVDALLDVAERHDARFIVVGTYGEGPLRGAILGSVAQRLLQRSPRPVVVVPAAPR